MKVATAMSSNTNTRNPAGPVIALAISHPDSLEQLIGLGPSPSLLQCLKRLGCPAEMIDAMGQDRTVERIHLGNEFCERLLPTPTELAQVQTLAEQLQLEISLVTPMLTDAGVNRLDKLLPKLDSGCEVVVNDWGTLRRLRSDYPALVPVLGRMLNKMIKDPRLPSEQWTKLHPHNSQSQHFIALLQRFSIDRLEMDVPPFAKVDHFNSPFFFHPQPKCHNSFKCKENCN